jgi:hypothetical protein
MQDPTSAPLGRPGRKPIDIHRLLNLWPSLPDDARVQPCVVRALFGGIAEPTYRRWVKKGLIPKAKHGTHSAGEIRAALHRLSERAAA